MKLEEHQSELRHTYVGGGPGAIVSGVIWLAAGATALATTTNNGFYLLFFAGMFIFPISKLVLSTIYRRPPESKDNPGGLIVIETVFPMIGGFFAALLLLPTRPEVVFPVSAIAVGAHYFGFRTAYGDWTYWLFGSVLCLIGVVSIMFGMPTDNLVPIVVAVVEIAFGVWFILADRKQSDPNIDRMAS
ncbi:MAG: hypothetical protein AAFN77_03715 [Planctomycetota bacterium]